MFLVYIWTERWKWQNCQKQVNFRINIISIANNSQNPVFYFSNERIILISSIIFFNIWNRLRERDKTNENLSKKLKMIINKYCEIKQTQPTTVKFTDKEDL